MSKLPIGVMEIFLMWNKIEHELFSFIIVSWRGKPLLTYRTLVRLITATTSSTGLTVKARLDRRKYVKGLKVSEATLKKLKLRKRDFHGEWNYTITPRKRARTIQ